MIPVMLAWTIATGAVAAEGTVRLLPSPLVFPKRIGPMALVGEPHKYDDPRLGVSYQYGGQGLSLTVYIYDTGQADLPDGADTIPSCQEFETAKQGVEQSYQKVELKSQYLARLNPPDATPQVREALYEYEREGKPSISYIWVTTVAKHFVKLRMSMDPRLRDEVADARREILSTLGGAIEPHLATVDPKAEPAGTTMNVNSLGGSKEDMASGFMYLVLLATVAEEFPDLGPVCGGEFIPSYEAELGVYRTLVDMDDKAAGKSARQLSLIAKADFLDEFVWVELHRESWGASPPEGLALADYKTWKGKNLKRFKAPTFGSMVVDHPRPLPPEPPTP